MKNTAQKNPLPDEIFEIGGKMIKASLPKDFIIECMSTALKYEAFYQMMKLWEKEKDPKEKNEIIADLQEMILDSQRNGTEKGKTIRFDDLNAIAKNIQKFKNTLREKIEEKGGILKVSKISHIPQPSLSRFFNSASMPQRKMLIKLSKALDLSEIEIDAPWVT